MNTIVAGNTLTANTGVPNEDVTADLTSGGHNLIGIDNNFKGPTDLAGTAANPLNPNLGPLQNNGGPTQTLLPLSGSPVLGAGDPSLAPSTDQRGNPRRLSGPIDIGAVQVSGNAISPPPAPAPAPTLHTPFLLGLLDHLFFVASTEMVNSDGTVSVTDSVIGIRFLVSHYNSAGNLVSVLFFGVNVTPLFTLFG